jgi:Sortase domain
MLGSSRWHPSRSPRAWIAVVLAIVGVVSVWAAVASPSTPHSALAGAPIEHSGTTPSAPSPKPSAGADQIDVRDQIKGLVLPASDPVAVSIPRIGVRSGLVELGLDGGKMEVPHPSDVGWFTGGATPGALGPAVIAAHVTWDRAPAVFYRLDTMRRGDQVSVTRKDGRTAVFTVSRVVQFPKSQFPSRAVYGAIDHAGLRLITCGGSYDATAKRYLDNVVVFARLTGVREPDR